MEIHVEVNQVELMDRNHGLDVSIMIGTDCDV